MQFSSDLQDHLPPGFRFEPTDVELIDYYLRRRRASRIGAETYSFIHELDVYAHAPWDIVPAAIADDNDGEESMQQHYFFSCRRPTSKGSKRVNRNAGCGFWHCHGHDIVIRDPADPNRVIGHKIQLNFKVVDEFNRKKTTKTSWIMHEYQLESDEFQQLVLCRIYDKKRSNINNAEMVVRAAAAKRPRTEIEELSTPRMEEEDERGGVKRQRVQVVDPEPAADDHDQNCFGQIVPFVDQQEPMLMNPIDDQVDAQQFTDAGDTATAAEPSSSRADEYEEEEAGGGSSDQDWLSSPGMLAFLEEYSVPNLDDYVDILAEGQSLQQTENPWPPTSQAVADDQELYADVDAAAEGQLLLMETAECCGGAERQWIEHPGDPMLMSQAVSMEQGPANCSGSAALIDPWVADDFFANMFATMDSTVALDNFSYFDM